MLEKTVRHVEVFDAALALSSVGGDSEFLNEVVGLIRAAWPTLLADIRQAIAMGDLRAVERTARLAKAAARNVSAKRAYDSAAQLESLVGMRDLPAAQRASRTLEHEVEKLQVVLSTLESSACSS
ncbi:MAG TPA: Hpt domain-containing protein [Terriglobia bacterium]|nr:Hpt domain-containing protein [Terriglobia bacterium]